MPYTYKNIQITKYPQSGFLLEYENQTIYIDPFRLPDDQPMADYIFLTHEHYDHCDPESLIKIMNDNTILVGNALVSQKLLEEQVEFNEFVEVAPEDKIDLEKIHFETVPAYNIDKDFHPRQNEGVGYILHLGDVQIFHLGDTDNIPEFENVLDIEVALVPISGTYVMDVDQAVEATRLINPEVVIPMHHDASIAGSKEDANVFAEKLSGDVQVTIL